MSIHGHLPWVYNLNGRKCVIMSPIHNIFDWGQCGAWMVYVKNKFHIIVFLTSLDMLNVSTLLEKMTMAICHWHEHEPIHLILIFVHHYTLYSLVKCWIIRWMDTHTQNTIVHLNVANNYRPIMMVVIVHHDSISKDFNNLAYKKRGLIQYSRILIIFHCFPCLAHHFWIKRGTIAWCMFKGFCVVVVSTSWEQL